MVQVPSPQPKMKADTLRVCFRFWLWIVILTMLLLGYVTDERCSLGRNTERTQWVIKRGVSCSAVKLRKQFGYRERAQQTQSVCENNLLCTILRSRGNPFFIKCGGGFLGETQLKNIFLNWYTIC